MTKGFLSSFDIRRWSCVYLDRIEVADLHADAAAYTYFRIDCVKLAAFSADGSCRAVAGAYRAAGAGTFQDHKADQCLAYFRRAAFFIDVGFVFVPEVLERADDRVRCSLSQAAQAGRLDLGAQRFQQLDITIPPFTITDTLQGIEDAAGAHPAGRALATAFVLSEIHEVTGDIHHAGFFVHHHHTP